MVGMGLTPFFSGYKYFSILNTHWAFFDTLVGENGRVLVYFCLGHAGDDVIAFTSF